jgi:hypothetical protein
MNSNDITDGIDESTVRQVCFEYLEGRLEKANTDRVAEMERVEQYCDGNEERIAAQAATEKDERSWKRREKRRREPKNHH